jgi:putative sigma-54 modulation protein
MQVEYTGRQVAVTPAYRVLAEEGLERVGQILGKSFGAHVVLTAEKYRQSAEVTVQSRHHSLVGICESTSMETALRDAVAKVETQAKKLKEKVRESKRQPKEEKLLVEAPVRRNGAAAVASGKNGAKNGKADSLVAADRKLPAQAVTLHAAKTSYEEPHIVRSADSVSDRPMTIEEAVKEAEFRDKEVFVFRTPVGSVNVLHRKRDGKMELIEAS